MLHRSLTAALMVLALAVGTARAAAPKPSLDESTAKDARRAIDIALRWLDDQQAADGHWSVPEYPAVTALVTWAYLRNPARAADEIEPHAQKGVDYIMGCVRKDGGIYNDVGRPRGGGLRNYNTAICMTALAATGKSKYDDVIMRARAFLIAAQHLEKDEYYGGWGYDAGLDRNYADIDNTAFTVEALKFTQFIARQSCAPPKAGDTAPEKKPGDQPPDANWQAAAAFLARCQNLPQKDAPGRAVSLRAQDRGGLFYEPNRGQAGGEKDAEGRATWYSYGNASYSGLICFLHADLKRDDSRVVGVVDWVRRNYTLDEHPGQGKQGLYFYYRVMARALWAWGEEPLKLADGRQVDWRRDLIIKLVSLQRIDPKTGLGYWVNDNGRWMENDPVLVTAYAVLTLETLLPDTRP